MRFRIESPVPIQPHMSPNPSPNPSPSVDANSRSGGFLAKARDRPLRAPGGPGIGVSVAGTFRKAGVPSQRGGLPGAARVRLGEHFRRGLTRVRVRVRVGVRVGVTRALTPSEILNRLGDVRGKGRPPATSHGPTSATGRRALGYVHPPNCPIRFGSWGVQGGLGVGFRGWRPFALVMR